MQEHMASVPGKEGESFAPEEKVFPSREVLLLQVEWVLVPGTGLPHPSIDDSRPTQVPQEDMVKVVAWYDNEWAYAMRLVELVEKVAAPG